jgi:hypothetical protein
MKKYLLRIIAMSSLGIMLLFSSGWCAETDGVQPGTNGETLGAGTDQENKSVEAVNADAGKATGAAATTVQPEEKSVQAVEKGAADKSTDELINELKARKIITEEQAVWLLQKYRGQNVRPSGGSFDEDAFIKEVAKELSSQMKQDVQTQVKDELKAQILKEARMGNWLTPALPEWAARLKFSGDLRVRYQGDYFSSDNADLVDPNNPTQLMNTKIDRQRLRLRARLNTLIQVADQVDAGITIATGTTSNPVTNNVTLGDYQNKKSIILDKAYLRYRPMPELSLWAGKFANPWFSTDLVWDPNLTFDGVAFQFDTQMGRPFRTFLTAGVFPVQEVEFSARDKWLFAGQTGMKWIPADIVNAKFGVAYYHYKNITGEVSRVDYPGENDFTAPQFLQKGNTLMDINPDSSTTKLALASEFHELDFTASIDVSVFDPVHVTLTGDYVKNIGFDRSEVAARSLNNDIKKDNTGYKLILAVGNPGISDFGDWRFSIARERLEADAVVDAYTSSDFHLGGTNAEGYVLTGEFGLTRNVWCSAQWYSTNEISGPKLAIDTLQLDVNVRF